jgi:hypothetical protein
LGWLFYCLVGNKWGKHACISLPYGVRLKRILRDSFNQPKNMTTLHKAKKGRSAGYLAMDEAANIVAMYREAQAQADGKLYMSYLKDGKLVREAYADAFDIETLLNFLDEFSKTGYFRQSDDELVYRTELLVLRNEYAQKLKKFNRPNALQELARERKVPIKTISSRLTEAKKMFPKS